MSTDIATRDLTHVLETAVMTGDLSAMRAPERLVYYRAVCESVGLNPLTKPFEYLSLNGRTVLYAKRDATDQLRRIHGVHIERLERDAIEGIYTVTAYAKDRTGRIDSAIGAVSIESLKGEARANAIMKAETKAKRRVTLSICGLGLLDETEVDAIPGARLVDPATGDPIPGEQGAPSSAEAEERLALLEIVSQLGDRLGMNAKEKAAAWKEHCGEASRHTADVSALQALADDLQARAKKLSV